MTLSAAMALLMAMFILALLPGPGILIVVSRTLAHGLHAGILTSLGILTGDFVFIALAVYGLSALANWMGELFLLIKYVGGAYLFYLGAKILWGKARATNTQEQPLEIAASIEGAVKNRRLKKMAKHSTNYMAGLLTTLSNPKAMLFYASFFPTFLDLTKLDGVDIAIILLITTITVFGTMCMYAYATSQSGRLLKNSRLSNALKWVSGSMLMGAGVYIAVRS